MKPPLEKGSPGLLRLPQADDVRHCTPHPRGRVTGAHTSLALISSVAATAQSALPSISSHPSLSRATVLRMRSQM